MLYEIDYIFSMRTRETRTAGQTGFIFELRFPNGALLRGAAVIVEHADHDAHTSAPTAPMTAAPAALPTGLARRRALADAIDASAEVA